MSINYSDLNLTLLNNTNSYTIGDNTINVLQYLPIEKKFELMEHVTDLTINNNRFISFGLMQVHLDLYLLYYYTDIEFTDAEKENPGQLYDILMTNGILPEVLKCIPESEKQWLYNHIKDTLTSIHNYNNSLAGMIDTLTSNYGEASEEFKGLQDMIANPENLTLLKDVLTKLG